MSNLGKRLAEERKRLGFNQEVMATHGGVKKQAQSLYESGKRKPDSEYLTLVAKVGVDVSYVITGISSEPQLPTLTTDQQMLLEAYQALPVAQQKTLLASLLMGEASKQANANSPKEVKKPAAGKISKSRGMNIIGEQNSISVGGDIKG